MQPLTCLPDFHLCRAVGQKWFTTSGFAGGTKGNNCFIKKLIALARASMSIDTLPARKEEIGTYYHSETKGRAEWRGPFLLLAGL